MAEPYTPTEDEMVRAYERPVPPALRAFAKERHEQEARRGIARIKAEALSEFGRAAAKRNIGTLSYRQQVLQHAESTADLIEKEARRG